jgi:hypothetical protein
VLGEYFNHISVLVLNFGNKQDKYGVTLEG